MKCRNCGAEYEEGTLFCPKCRHESIINAKNFIIETKQPDAKTQCRL